MRRFMALGLIWVLFCAAAVVPARWAAALLPDSAKAHIIPDSVSGSIWQGQAKVLPPKTTWPIEAIYKINPLSALIARPYAKTQLSGYGFRAGGLFGVWGSSRMKLKEVTADFQISQLPISDPRFSGLSGQIFLTFDDLNIKNGCQSAAGQARSDILTANEQSWQWTGPILSGPISCDGEAVLAALRGRNNDYDVALDLRLYADGVYGVDVTLTPIGSDKGRGADGFGFVLGLLGFEENPDGSAQLREKGNIFQGQRYE